MRKKLFLRGPFQKKFTLRFKPFFFLDGLYNKEKSFEATPREKIQGCDRRCI